MSLQLFGLLFSSSTWKVLTALWTDEAHETPSQGKRIKPIYA